MIKTKNKIYLIAIVLLLGSCQTWQNHRCQRVKQHLPQCIEKIYVPVQTTRIDTLYRTYKTIDTVFRLSKDSTHTDTFIVYNQKTKTIITIKHDTLKVKQYTTPDTITKTYIKTVEKHILKNNTYERYVYIAIFIAIVLILIRILIKTLWKT